MAYGPFFNCAIGKDFKSESSFKFDWKLKKSITESIYWNEEPINALSFSEFPFKIVKCGFTTLFNKLHIILNKYTKVKYYNKNP